MSILANACSEARSRHQESVRVEHLLLALVKSPSGTPAKDALTACGVDEASVSEAVEQFAQAPEPVQSVSLDPRLNHIEGIARGLALANGSDQPASEQFLLAIVWARDGHLESVGTSPAAVQDALAHAGVPVPELQAPPPTIDRGESFKVTRAEMRIVLDRIAPLLSPPEVTVGVRWDDDGDHAWISAAKTIDLEDEIERVRTEHPDLRPSA